jgi:threonylcarbamoyladenosine tRNA methylthiotransferase MtaB
MENQVSPEVKQKRSEKMFLVVNEARKTYLDSYTGKTMEVLFEREARKGVFEGKTKNYITVFTKSNEDITGRILNVYIEKNDSEVCFGRLVL